MSRLEEPAGRQPTLAEARAAVDQMISGYWTTQIVYVAAKLGIADLLADGPRHVDTLATMTDTHAPSLYRFLRTLAGLGVVEERPDGQFETTILGSCLVAATPGARRARAIMSGETLYTAWAGLLHSVRTGETALDHIFGAPWVEHFARDPRTAALFNETMASSTTAVAQAVAGAYDFGQATTVVDVGGGTGTFLAGILQANPHLRGVLFDLPSVVSEADGLLADAGVADRCEVVAGDFFADDLPPGGDVYALSWIIHDWDDERSVAILRKCRRAMADDARLLVVEQVIPPGNDPSLAKLYDLHMLVLTAGRERTEDEYRHLLAAADLELTKVIATDAPRSVIEAVPRW